MTSPPESGPDRGHLLTEQANPLSERLDQLPTDELVGLFCANEREPQRALEAAAPDRAAARTGWCGSTRSTTTTWEQTQASS